METLKDLSELYRATTMLLSGQPGGAVDALFLHNRSFGDYTGLFEMAGAMIRQGVVKFITVTNNEGERVGSTTPLEANPGMSWCIDQLIYGHHILPERILHPDKKAFQTREENTAFLQLASERGWLSGVILTQPHQLLRATLGMVQAMTETGYMMAIYTATPTDTPWQAVVRGNQGFQEKPRADHIQDELERVLRSQGTGELATFEQLFAYLRARDTGHLLIGSIGRERFIL
ncbi:hypothetical protein HYT74_01110 [Candidatus Daviesbacteria bacterium]|nr:hypothetical protein [Candidatus Daviesbacteria bacterium]MBI2334531.1 hypothetical protein [Candidatus Daviesbacteria bacterium]MBI3109917.1 hypothetical protein [Candidatus Daviesbacteria bacterium]